MSAIDAEDEWAEAPYVCPGCHAVGGERCAPDCIDAQIEREREASEWGGEEFAPDDLNDSDDWEFQP